jgi:DNA-binding PadR family transcriptional regulator
MTRARPDQLLLGEWACLGILAPAPLHGFAVAARLKPDGDIGRIWSMSRALTYRAIEQLTIRGYIRPLGQEPGLAGGNRTILTVTPTGRAALHSWLDTPVTHLRDLRSELLLKIVLASAGGHDIRTMLQEQRRLTAVLTASHNEAAANDPNDIVAIWRAESSQAALRFLDRHLTLIMATSGNLSSRILRKSDWGSG